MPERRRVVGLRPQRLQRRPDEGHRAGVHPSVRTAAEAAVNFNIHLFRFTAGRNQPEALLSTKNLTKMKFLKATENLLNCIFLSVGWVMTTLFSHFIFNFLHSYCITSAALF